MSLDGNTIAIGTLVLLVNADKVIDVLGRFLDRFRKLPGAIDAMAERHVEAIHDEDTKEKLIAAGPTLLELAALKPMLDQLVEHTVTILQEILPNGDDVLLPESMRGKPTRSLVIHEIGRVDHAVVLAENATQHMGKNSKAIEDLSATLADHLEHHIGLEAAS